MSGNARPLAEIGKRSIAVVVEQQAGHGSEDSRNTVVRLAIRPRAAGPVVGFLRVHETANKKVEPAIVVAIKPDGAGRPTRSGQAGFSCHVRKRAVSIVVVQNAI